MRGILGLSIVSVSLLCATSCGPPESNANAPVVPRNPPAPSLVQIVFDPPAAAAHASTGNLILVRSAGLRAGHTATPGPWVLYAAGIATTRGVELTPGTGLTLAAPAGTGEVCAYLDVHRDFMQHFGAGPGSYYSSSCVVPSSAQQAPMLLRLDQIAVAREKKAPEWMSDHLVVLPDGDMSVPVLVGLPPGYQDSRERYPVMYVFHGFGGDRFTYVPAFELFREHMRATARPMIIVSVEGNGRFGPHLFVDSRANGMTRRALMDHVVPWVDQTFRTRAAASGRVVFGHSSGGWVALSLLLRRPDMIGFAFASAPDPIHMKSYWQHHPGNAYLDASGGARVLLNVPGQLSLSARDFVTQELRTGSFGQFSSLLAAFSPYVPGREPLPFDLPFDLETGAVSPTGWSAWERNDLYLLTAQNSLAAKRALGERLFLYVGDKDEFALDSSAQHYSELLRALGITHVFELLDGGHGDYVKQPAFLRRLWDSAWRAVTAPPPGLVTSALVH